MNPTHKIAETKTAAICAALAACAVAALFALQAYSIASFAPQKTEYIRLDFREQPAPKPQPRLSANSDFGGGAKIPQIGSTQSFAVEFPQIDSAALRLSRPDLSKFARAATDGSGSGFGGGSFAILGSQTLSDSDLSSDVFALDMLDKIPRRLDTTAVEYPKQMLRRGVEGDVELLVFIDRTGVVTVEKIVSATNKYFGESAAAAADKFVYEPPMRKGRAVCARFVLPIPFRISQ